MATIDSNNCIPSGLRVNIMRNSMENKNLLTKKGSTYVGIGETMTVGGVKIYKTKALEPGSNGEVLQVKNGDLGYDKIQNTAIDSSVNYTNLTNTLKNTILIPSQFRTTESYDNLKIIDQNIDYFSSSITKNIIITDGTPCAIMRVGSSYKRYLTLGQTEWGKLRLTYQGAGVGVYLHRITLRFTWKDRNSNSVVTYLSFAFVNNNKDTYAISSNSSLSSFLEAATSGQAVVGAGFAIGTLPLYSVSFYNASYNKYWTNYIFKANYNSNMMLGIQVMYYDIGWRTTDVLTYDKATYEIQSQDSVITLLVG